MTARGADTQLSATRAMTKGERAQDWIRLVREDARTKYEIPGFEKMGTRYILMALLDRCAKLEVQLSELKTPPFSSKSSDR